MSSNRFMKQALYAGLFAAFWLVVLSGFVWLLVGIGPRETVEDLPQVVAYEALLVEEVYSVSTGSGVDVAARLRNPNAGVGVEMLPVTFILLNGAGQEIKQVEAITHINAGALQYAAVLGVDTAVAVAEVKVLLPEEPLFKERSNELPDPSFNTFLTSRSQSLVAGRLFEEQQGVISNNSTADWHEIGLVVIAFDLAGQVSGIGTTTVGALTVGEQREFVVSWPASASGTNKALVFANTNVFAAEAIAPVVRDPSSLR